MLRWVESSRCRSQEVMINPLPPESGVALLPPPPEVEGPPAPPEGALLGLGGAATSSEVRKRWRRRWHMRRAPGSASGSAAASSVREKKIRKFTILCCRSSTSLPLGSQAFS